MSHSRPTNSESEPLFCSMSSLMKILFCQQAPIDEFPEHFEVRTETDMNSVAQATDVSPEIDSISESRRLRLEAEVKKWKERNQGKPSPLTEETKEETSLDQTIDTLRTRLEKEFLLQEEGAAELSRQKSKWEEYEKKKGLESQNPLTQILQGASQLNQSIADLLGSTDIDLTADFTPEEESRLERFDIFLASNPLQAFLYLPSRTGRQVLKKKQMKLSRRKDDDNAYFIEARSTNNPSINNDQEQRKSPSSSSKSTSPSTSSTKTARLIFFPEEVIDICRGEGKTLGLLNNPLIDDSRIFHIILSGDKPELNIEFSDNATREKYFIILNRLFALKKLRSSMADPGDMVATRMNTFKKPRGNNNSNNNSLLRTERLVWSDFIVMKEKHIFTNSLVLRFCTISSEGYLDIFHLPTILPPQAAASGPTDEEDEAEEALFPGKDPSFRYRDPLILSKLKRYSNGSFHTAVMTDMGYKLMMHVEVHSIRDIPDGKTKANGTFKAELIVQASLMETPKTVKLYFDKMKTQSDFLSTLQSLKERELAIQASNLIDNPPPEEPEEE